ncbi:MAG: histone deacetylase [Rhizobiaceae bacterium]|nr:histone deacetylase [Rhizobiaceae bacterium]
MPLHIVTHPDYDAGFAPTHRFPMGKYSALITSLETRGFLLPGYVHRPVPPPASWLSLAHDRAYVDQVIACDVPKRIEREIGFPIVERTARRALLASGGTILAARLALEQGIACNTAGGSHHARRAQGAGFCTFNDVAVACRVLLDEGTVNDILIVDLDVHQGDGTAEILASEPRAFTYSMHAARNYPVRKANSNRDEPLPDGTGDDVYLARLSDALRDLGELRAWDLVFYNAGVDPHVDDRLGRLALSTDGLRRRDEMVVRYFRERGVPLCGVLGGGYSHDVTELAERHAILFEVAAGFASVDSSAVG